MLRLDPTKFKRDLTAHSVSFFALDQTVAVDDAMIDALIIESQAACKRPARICLHTMPDADFHEMSCWRARATTSRHTGTCSRESCARHRGPTGGLSRSMIGAVFLTATVLGPRRQLIAHIGANIWHSRCPDRPRDLPRVQARAVLGMRDRILLPGRRGQGPWR